MFFSKGFCQTGEKENDQTVVTKKPRRFEYYFNSGIGFYFPTGSSPFLTDKGEVYAFNLQLNYKGNYFSHLYMDSDVLKYRRENVPVNNTVATIDCKLNTVNIGLDLGYTFPIKKLSPYVYGGAGVALIETPFLRGGSAPNEVTLGTEYKTFFQYRAAAGIDYELSRTYTVFLEAQYSGTAFKSAIDNRQLNGVSLMIGIRTPL